MAISDVLGNIYAGIEDKFFGVMDFLDDHGIPVYNVINPIEENGIPFFPLFLAFLVLVGALVYGFFVFGSGMDVNVDLMMRDQFRESLTGVAVTASVNGKQVELENKAFNDGDTIALKGVARGAAIAFTAKKEGYEDAAYQLEAISENAAATLSLKKIVSQIVGKFRLVDRLTGDPIKNANVVAKFSTGETVSCDVDDAGIVTCPNVPEGEKLRLQVRSDNYEDLDDYDIEFSADEQPSVSLAAKASAAEGSGTLIVRVTDEATGKFVDNASIKVYDVKSQEPISEAVDEDGEFTTQVPKGTSIRVVVSKDGYAKYDSSAFGIEKTIRDDEELLEVALKQGGAQIHVSVVGKASQQVISNATVMLFNEYNEKLEEAMTAFGGDVYFDNVSVESTYFVTAIAEGYLPARLPVNASETKEYTILLDNATAENSAYLSVMVYDSRNEPANNVALNFYEVQNEKEFPLGLAEQKTDITGFYSAQFEVGKTIAVKATAESEEGAGQMAIGKDAENKLEIKMEKTKGLVHLRLVDNEGNLVKGGIVTIKSSGGETLLDEENKDGETYFDPQDNKSVKFIYEFPDGTRHEEELYVENQDELSVNVKGTAGTGLSPKVDFLGIEDIDGKPADGMERGKEYFLKFSSEYPAGKYPAGFHVRVGDDTISMVDSQEIGILGFNGISGRTFYGRSFSPFPAPGAEAIDYQNTGRAGEYNRWLELNFPDGYGTKILKVRVKAKETGRAGVYPVFYRGWAQVGDNYYRFPEDQLLKFSNFTKDKTSLYAETLRGEIKVFDGKPKCENEFCASFRFISAGGTEYKTDNLKADLGNVYALEVQIAPQKGTSLTIKASTSKQNPRLTFTGSEIDVFAEPQDSNATETEIEVPDVRVDEGRTTKVRIYFKGTELGNAQIQLQMASLETVVDKAFFVDFFKEKQLSVKVFPDQIFLGDDFRLLVKDQEGAFVENATVKIMNESGRIVYTVIGNGTAKRGLNGLYYVKNSLGGGRFNYTVEAPNAKPFSSFVDVVKENAFLLPAEIRVDLSKNKLAGDASFEIKNTVSEQIDRITIEFDSKSDDFLVLASLPERLNGNERVPAKITATYKGKGSKGHYEAVMKVTGRMLEKYNVTGTTRVIVDYVGEAVAVAAVPTPRPGFLMRECLAFSKSNLLIYLPSNLESSREIFLNATNRCAVPLTFSTEIIQRGYKDSTIKVDAESFSLGAIGTPMATRTIRVAVSNKLERVVPQGTTYYFDVVYKSEQVTRAVPLQVVLWERKYGLEFNRNLEAYLTITKEAPEPTETLPLTVKNLGEADVENITFTVTKASEKGLVGISFEPAIPFQLLKRGFTMSPAPTLTVKGRQAAEKEKLEDVSEITVKGLVDGKPVDFGKIILTTHISPAECLVVSPNYLSFFTTKDSETTITEKVNVKNACAEEIRIREISPAKFGLNEIVLGKEDVSVAPNATVPLEIVFDKKENWFADSPATLKGFLVKSEKFTVSNTFNLHVEVGKQTAPTSASTVNIMDVQVCEKPEQRKSIAFPIIAEAENCSTAYCDAEQLAAFLARKVGNKVRDAQRQVSLKYRNAVSNTRCTMDEEGIARGYCSFDNLDIRPEAFEVYFMNDNLDLSLFRDIISKKSAELSAYNVDYIPSDKAFKTVLGTGLSKRILLTDYFKGCGKYNVELTGAVRVSSGAIIPEMTDILVDLRNEDQNAARQETEQCLPKIQNVMNFLPQDGSYTAGNTRQTWLGIVQSDEKGLEDLGENFASSLFGKKERYVAGAAPTTNKIMVRFSADREYLLKLNMIKAGSGQPQTIYAEVKKPATTVEKSRETVEKEIFKIAGQTVRDIKNNRVVGCITENENEFRIKGVEEVAALKATSCVPDKMSVQIGKEICCDFNVSSTTAEDVKLKMRLETGDISRGLDSYLFRDLGRKEVKETDAVKLDKPDNEGNNQNTFSICVTGNKFMQFVVNKKIFYQAESAVTPQSKSEEHSTELQLCGIHPYDMMDRIAKEDSPEEGKEKVFYATLAWKGEPETITLANLKKYVDAQFRVQDASELTKQGILEGSKMPGQVEYEEKLKSQKNWGLLAYGTACTAASIAANLLLRANAIGAVIGTAMDCGIPVGNALGKQWGYWGTETEQPLAEATAKPDISQNPPKGVRPQDEQIESLLATGAIAGSAKSIGRGFIVAANQLTEPRINAVSKQLSERWAGEMFEQLVGNEKEILEAAEKTARTTYTGIYPHYTPAQINTLVKTHVDGVKSNLTTARGATMTKIKTAIETKMRAKMVGEITKKHPFPMADFDTLLEKVKAETFKEVAEGEAGKEFSDAAKYYLSKETREAMEHAYEKQIGEVLEKTSKEGFEAVIGESKAFDFKDLHGQKMVKQGSEAVVTVDPATGRRTVQNVWKTTYEPDWGDWARTTMPADAVQRLDTTVESIADEMSEKMVKGLNEEARHLVDPTTMRDSLKNLIYQKVEKRVVAGAHEISVSQFQHIVKDAIIELNDKVVGTAANPVKLKEVLEANFKEPVNKELFAKFSAELDSKLLEKGKIPNRVRMAKFKSFFTNIASWTFWKEFLVRGVLPSAIAQAAGWAAWKVYWEKFAEPITPTDSIVGVEQVKDYEQGTNGELCNGVDDNKNGIVDEGCTDVEVSDEVPLAKYETYKVTIRNEFGKKKVVITQVRNAGQIEADKLLGDCTGKAFEKEADKHLPGLLPDVRKWDTKIASEEARYVVRYYEKYGPMIANSQEKFGVPEALLVAVGIWQSDFGTGTSDYYITGCNRNMPEFSNPASSFDCAAGKIKKLSKTCPSIQGEEGLRCVLEAYGKEYKPQTKYPMERVVDIYNRWNESKFTAS